MVEPELQDVPEWMESGRLHLQHLDYAEALNCFRQALMLNPNLPEGWLNYGSVLEKLGCYGAAIAANTNAQKLYASPTLRLAPPEPEPTEAIAAALALQSASADYWLGRGHALCDQGDYDQAIASYDKALALRPQDAQAWFGRGNMAAALGDFETAIASYDQATKFEPNDYQTWNNRGYALHRLGQYEEAITSYDRAIACKADCAPAWNNRGYALFHLEQHEAAIVEFDQALALYPSYAEAWHNRGRALGALGRFKEAIVDYDKALALKPEFEEARENRAIVLQALEAGVDGDENSVNKAYIDEQATDSESQFIAGQGHYRKGKNQYTEGSKQLNPFPHWLAAEESYIKALELLRIEDFAVQHLTILQELLTLRCQLLRPEKRLTLLHDAAVKLQKVLQNPELSPSQKLTLERQFEGFNQLKVDALAQQDPVQALELAEASKNRCLGRLRDRWAYQSPSHAQIQSLLSPRIAAIYWHLSPAALTTFILKHNQPPQVLESKPAPTELSAPPLKTAYPAAAYQLRELETWLKTWKQDYSTARDLPPQAQAISPWRSRMEWMLNARLRTILEIPRICLDYLQDVDQLILIPHRDLHLIPLHILFPERYTVTYLPSAQLGLELQHHPTPSIQRLLSIEDPATQWVKAKGGTHGLLYAQLESALVTQLYGKAITQSVPRETATKLRVTAALKLMSGCLHFTGRSYHNPEDPAQSALALAGEDLLSLKDLWQLDLRQYNLICLSFCETGTTSTQAITDEYIGLVSGFLGAGAAHVISTLWPVDEISSALLMIEFHRNLLKEALPPAQALAKAQQWLRTGTNAELSQWHQTRHAELAKVDPYGGATEQFRCLAQEAGNAQDPHKAPFEHPYHWAGFTLTGKVPQPNL